MAPRYWFEPVRSRPARSTWLGYTLQDRMDSTGRQRWAGVGGVVLVGIPGVEQNRLKTSLQEVDSWPPTHVCNRPEAGSTIRPIICRRSWRPANSCGIALVNQYDFVIRGLRRRITVVKEFCPAQHSQSTE